MLIEELRTDLFRSAMLETGSSEDSGKALQWLETARKDPGAISQKADLSDVMLYRHGDGKVTDERIKDEIACLKTTLKEREVTSWCQPQAFNRKEHFCGLIITKIKDTYFWLMQVVEEPGIIGSAQIGPSVQTDAIREGAANSQVYSGLFSNPERSRIVFDVIHSEEGGRFYRDKKRFMCLLLPEGEVKINGPKYKLVSGGAVKKLVQKENVLNIFARNFLAILL